MNSRVIVSALISDKDQYLFIKQNKSGGAYPDTLHIPGGGLEQDENPKQALRREIREEVGVELRNIKPIDFDWDVLDYKGENTLLIFLRFTAEISSGQAVASSDAKEILWISKDELSKQKHNPPTNSLLKKLTLI